MRLEQPGLFDAPAPPRMRVTLYHEDCFKVMPKLANNSANLIFADLPYGRLKWKSWDEPLDLIAAWDHFHRLLDGQGIVTATADMRFATTLIASHPKAFKYDLVWQKHLASNFMMGKRRPLSVHEHVLIFSFGNAIYNPQMRPESERKNRRIFKVPPKAKDWHAGTLGRVASKQGEMYPLSVLSTNESRKLSLHPTQKPVALLEWLIRTYTNEGDTVLDPCMGSGTCAIACLNTGRHFIGIEKDKGYFDIAAKRIAARRAELGVRN